MANFQKLSPQQKAYILTSPFSVPVTENPDMETQEQNEKLSEMFHGLLRGVKYKLSLFETSQKIQYIAQKYGFELLHLANITRLIREYYFGEVPFENFPKEIEKRMGVSLLTAQEITRYIRSEIIDWDPWGEYIAKLPKLTVREIVQGRPKIADQEITAGYISLQNSDDLEDPTIKNWVHDYVLHLGQTGHSQMDRTEYLFHSENGRNLSSPDREKLSIILRSFDENIPLPVDEENGEIVFESMISDRSPMIKDQRLVINSPATTATSKLQPMAAKQESFIKPYLQEEANSPIQPAKSTNIQTADHSPVSFVSQNYIQPALEAKKVVGPEFVSQHQPPPASHSEIDKFFAAPEEPGIPPIKIHSITDRNEPAARPAPPKTIPEQNIPRPAPLPPVQQNIPRPVQPAPVQSPREDFHPKYKMIHPFNRISNKPASEPRISGNVVDLRDNDQ